MTATAPAPATAGHPLGLRDAVAAEWLKLATVRSTWWFAGGLLAILLAMAVLDDGDAASMRSLTVGLAAVSYFGQYLIAAFGLLVITSELATRLITVTFAATPSRGRVMVAKAIVTAIAALVVGAIAASLGMGVAVAAVRYGELGRVAADIATQALATGIYLGLLAVVALGIGALVRRTAGALTVTVMLLLVVPELLRLASERFVAPFLNTLVGWTPAQAGWRLMTGEWEYALVLVAWAAAAVAVGAWALRGRDA
ncbi:ABC transporter permease [Allosalinactinospora lopnorensis]|uniref:ABC transporter permease n=1 Tax=Allosalinactinospora lopnorensis TaxID=1352348 RepID=UPI000623FC17|nr:ABC transporter permease [Allosalinactinospora lopnorensis]